MAKSTIIIPTYNRPIFLKRLLTYLNKFDKDFKVIVADSSTNENKKQNGKIVNLFQKLDVNYMNDFSVDTNPYIKMASAVDELDSEYGIFCADDDFVSPLAISLCTEFLDKNSDYSSAGGKVFSFFVKPNENNINQFYWKDYLAHRRKFMTVDHEKARDRLRSNFSNYIPILYYIQRSENMKHFHNELRKYTDDVRFGELLPGMLTVIYGKIKTLEILFGARQHNFQSIGSTMKGIPDYVKAGTYDSKFARFKECLISNLIKKDTISKSESEVLINEGMSEYVDALLAREKNRKSLRTYLKRFRINLKQYRRLSFKIRTNLSLWNINPMENSIDEFTKIKEVILDSHQN